jgi:CheY-like chemotaxis protein
MTPPREQDPLIDRAIGLARRSAWHAQQSANLAYEAQELLDEAQKLQQKRPSSVRAHGISARSAVEVPRVPTVLIVDDDHFVTETFARTLKLAGYDVVTATTAPAAVQAATVRPPDLILLDLHLPSTNGLALLRELRSVPDQQATPVAVITGDYFLGDDLTRELIELGAQLRFKPIWAEDLVALTHSLLQRPTT